MTAEDQGSTKHGNGDRRILRRREAQERTPIVLLECVERRENGTQDSNDDDKDT